MMAESFARSRTESCVRIDNQPHAFEFVNQLFRRSKAFHLRTTFIDQ